MNIKDLRIGNYVYHKDYRKKILVFSRYRKEFALKDIYGTVKSKEFSMQPIPITRDWLIMFGFVRTFVSIYDGIYCLKEADGKVLDLVRVRIMNGKFAEVIDRKHIKYIHQLQNLVYANYNFEITFLNKKT